MVNYLEHEREAGMLASSPLGPTIEAVRVGAPLPRLPPDATEWVDPMTGLESLTIAAWLQCPRLARALLAAGAPVDGPAEAYDTPAMSAAAATQWEIVALLLDAGADPLRGSTHPGTSVLGQAAAFGHLSTLRRILDDIDLEASGPAVADALGSATSAERVESVRVLLEAGVQPTASTLLWASETHQDPELFELLIAAAADGVDDSGVGPEVEQSNALELCKQLAASDNLHYRRKDLERIAAVLGEELPC